MSKWPMVKLGEVCEISMGQSPKGSNVNTQGDGVPIVGGMSEFSETGVQTNKWTTHPTRLCNPRDVLLSVRATIGPWRIADKEYCLGRGIAGLRPLRGLDRGFLTSVLDAKREVLLSKARGATFLQITKSDLVDLEIPLPPLEEQKRIAGILEASARQLEKVREELVVLDSMEASIVSKFAEGINRYVALSDIGSFSGGMTPSKGKKEYWNGEIPWFSSKDLKEDQLSDSIDHLSEIAIEETSIKPLKQPGIAISMRGMSLAHSIPSSRIPAGSCVNQDLKVVTPKPSQSLLVLHALIRQKENYLLSKVASSAHGTRKLDFEYLRNLRVPDMPEGKARFLDSALVTMQSQKSMIRNKMHLLEELHQSLATRAFAGEL